MTDKTIPAAEVRKIIASYRDGASNRGGEILAALKALVPAPPTLVDIPRGERASCQWMQADTETRGRAVILHPEANGGLAVLLNQWGKVIYEDHEQVIPRPDLPRMEWPAGQDAEEAAPVKVGDVIESADDPRLDALPAGSALLDRDDDAVTKQGEAWTGDGYIPNAEEGDEFGPWTVAHIPKKPAPALPGGWRLADHKVSGRVIVTNPTPDSDGHVYFVMTSPENTMGYDWFFCDPDELTFLDTGQEAADATD